MYFSSQGNAATTQKNWVSALKILKVFHLDSSAGRFPFFTINKINKKYPITLNQS
jgi:hypothetical protein